MPGDNGKLGTQYRLGAKGSELVFTLEKAEFASRAILKDGAMFAAPGERLLVLTYAIQNPGTGDAHFFNQSFTFTVVSPDDENYAKGSAAYHPDRRDSLNMQLKPAQKVRALAVIRIHPNGPVNKLIVQRGKNTPVLRYDLKEKVKPLLGAFGADAGLNSVEVGASMLTVPFELGPWDVTVEKVEESPVAVGTLAPEAGEKVVVATMTVKNAALEQFIMHGSILQPKMTDADGTTLRSHGNMLKMSADDSFNMMMDPAAQVRFRMVFYAPLLAKPEKLLLKEYNSERSVVVTLSPPKD